MDNKLRQALHTLECYNGIFRQLWELGRIHFTESVPTACIRFDKEGNGLQFCFNPKLYEQMSNYEVAFVIAHECMHVMLYHGRRFVKRPDYKSRHEVWNIAADIAIHEILFGEFGFDRSLITTIEPCTVDGVFKDSKSFIRRGETTEYYFDKLHKEGKVKYVSFDEHDFDDAFANAADSAMQKAYRRLTEIEKKELQRKVGQKVEDKEKRKNDNNVGTGAGITVYDALIHELPKKKWELIIKEWAQAFLKTDKYDWTRRDRRISHLPKDMFLPGSLEQHYKKQKLWMFLDTSGSCIDLAPRFLSAAASLPPKFFDVRVFCFDTKIYEIDIRKQEVLGGGGTSFDIIEEYIRKQPDNPDCVFVTTDGYGNDVFPAEPKKWHVFLTSDNRKNFPKQCNFHSFKEGFE